MGTNTYSKNDVFWETSYSKQSRFNLTIKSTNLMDWLNSQGFGRYVTNQSRNDDTSIVRYKDGTLYVFNIKSLKDYIITYFKEASGELFKPNNPLCVFYDDNYPVQGYFTKNDLLERLSRDNLVTQYHYSFLQTFTPDNPKLFMDTKDKVYVKFKNKIVVVSANDISEMEWNSKLNGSVWETEVNPHEIKINHNYNDGDGGLFEKFIQATCKDETESGGTEWNDNYVLDEKKYNVLKNTYGYMISNHKTPLEGKCVVFIDKDSDNFNAKGGTGKSVVMNSVQHWKSTRINDGRKQSSFDSKFLFSDVDYDTKFVHIQDLSKGFDFGVMYNVINDTLEIEPKYKSKLFIPFEYSPKFGVTTNYIDVDTNNHSTMRRQQIIEFGNYWKKCVANYNETPSDKKHLGKELFRTEFSDTDWNEFYNYGFRCIQSYLQEGLISQDLSDMRKKVMRYKVEGQKYTGEFDWICNWIENDRVLQGGHIGIGIRFDDIYSQFFNDLGNQLMIMNSSYKSKFKRKLWDTCEGLGYEYNREQSSNNGGDTPSSRRHLVVNKETGKNDEYICITKFGENQSIPKGSDLTDTNTLTGRESVLNDTGNIHTDNVSNYVVSGSSSTDDLGDRFEEMLKQSTNKEGI